MFDPKHSFFVAVTESLVDAGCVEAVQPTAATGNALDEEVEDSTTTTLPTSGCWVSGRTIDNDGPEMNLLRCVRCGVPNERIFRAAGISDHLKTRSDLIVPESEEKSVIFDRTNALDDKPFDQMTPWAEKLSDRDNPPAKVGVKKRPMSYYNDTRGYRSLTADDLKSSYHRSLTDDSKGALRRSPADEFKVTCTRPIVDDARVSFDRQVIDDDIDDDDDDDLKVAPSYNRSDRSPRKQASPLKSSFPGEKDAVMVNSGNRSSHMSDLVSSQSLVVNPSESADKSSLYCADPIRKTARDASRDAPRDTPRDASRETSRDFSSETFRDSVVRSRKFASGKRRRGSLMSYDEVDQGECGQQMSHQLDEEEELDGEYLHECWQGRARIVWVPRLTMARVLRIREEVQTIESMMDTVEMNLKDCPASARSKIQKAIRIVGDACAYIGGSVRKQERKAHSDENSCHSGCNSDDNSPKNSTFGSGIRTKHARCRVQSNPDRPCHVKTPSCHQCWSCRDKSPPCHVRYHLEASASEESVCSSCQASSEQSSRKRRRDASPPCQNGCPSFPDTPAAPGHMSYPSPHPRPRDGPCPHPCENNCQSFRDTSPSVRMPCPCPTYPCPCNGPCPRPCLNVSPPVGSLCQCPPPCIGPCGPCSRPCQNVSLPVGSLCQCPPPCNGQCGPCSRPCQNLSLPAGRLCPSPLPCNGPCGPCHVHVKTCHYQLADYVHVRFHAMDHVDHAHVHVKTCPCQLAAYVNVRLHALDHVDHAYVHVKTCHYQLADYVQVRLHIRFHHFHVRVHVHVKFHRPHSRHFMLKVSFCNSHLQIAPLLISGSVGSLPQMVVIYVNHAKPRPQRIPTVVILRQLGRHFSPIKLRPQPVKINVRLSNTCFQQVVVHVSLAKPRPHHVKTLVNLPQPTFHIRQSMGHSVIRQLRCHVVSRAETRTQYRIHRVFAAAASRNVIILRQRLIKQRELKKIQTSFCHLANRNATRTKIFPNM